MPTATYIPLATLTLTGNDSQIDFANIPSSYKDLVLVMSVGVTSGLVDLDIRVNSDSGSNYSRVYMYGSGSGTDSASSTATAFRVGLGSASERILTRVNFQDYSATDKHKTVLSRSDGAVGLGTAAYAGRWANTNAISTISISGATMTSGSTFSLYGIAG